MTPRRAGLVVVLRLFACVDLLALGAVVMPRAWMTNIHSSLGMGQLPDGPVVGYLARSAAWLYAMHGAAILVMSFDVERYERLITFFAIAALAHGVVMLAIGLVEDMPWWWVAIEGPTVTATGIAVLVLQRRGRLV